MVTQWLRFCAPNAGGPGSILGQGTGSHMSQLSVHTPHLKVPHVTTKKILDVTMKREDPSTAKTQHSQINKQTEFFFFLETRKEKERER